VGIDLHDGSQVNKTIKYPDLGDIITPEQVDACYYFIWDQVGIDSIMVSMLWVGVTYLPLSCLVDLIPSSSLILSGDLLLYFLFLIG